MLAKNNILHGNYMMHLKHIEVAFMVIQEKKGNWFLVYKKTDLSPFSFFLFMSMLWHPDL